LRLPKKEAPLKTLAIVASLVLAPALAASAPPNDPWGGLRALLGEWTGEGGGKPGESTSAGFSFALDLGDRIVVRKSHSDYAPRPGEKQSVTHDDLMIVYPAGDGLKAIYFDNEGHVIEYGVTLAAERVAFETDASAPGPRFKIEYDKRGPDALAITFSIAPPGGVYQPYVSGTARRK
jgi:hypothetical protein